MSVVYNFKFVGASTLHREYMCIVYCIVCYQQNVEFVHFQALGTQTHTHAHTEHWWLFGQYVSRFLYEDSVSCMELFARHLFVDTYTLACVVPSLSFQGSVCLAFFCACYYSFFFVFIYSMVLFSLSFIHMYERTHKHAIIIVRHNRAIKIHFTFEFVFVCVQELALFLWLSKRRTTLF